MRAAILQARRFLRAEKPDLVVTSNWGAIEWAIGARLAGVRHVHTEDGFGPEERTAQLPRRVLTRRIALRGRAVILPSRTLLRIATQVWRLPTKNLHYIPNGIDLARFGGATPAELPPGEGPVIGTVAALRAEKNIGRLIRAFAAVRAAFPARLVIVGDGPEMPMLQNLARELGMAHDVHFAGHSKNAESWLAAFDIFAISSDTEQMPLSLLEAMAAGLPALSTDVGDVRSMLSEENGPFVTAIDDKAFAAGLRAMLSKDTGGIGEANRGKAKREYSLDAMIDRHAKILGV
jgi:glycosyltransferase involved in cell wall biosynthesis